ncbi:probable tubulin polyglutamylase ttll-15 isoform X2 [Octopus sinensis]|uniref:Probable tubulin polyglutamylase ttll-15 isoform X2 n=1 Tax=Octopus sinensis TaxID=2607531 RepID=A0A6P7TGW7_9MOLL|nr:probable tubulin polyglutamylase ttll-15 isoform X2 [Octopus sinensis]XP_036368576.1 probable tubulin polyglutamylase ttll-15 isoform X2 [Octopus sinensis]
MTNIKDLEKALAIRQIKRPKMRVLNRLSSLVLIILVASVLLILMNVVVLHKIWQEQVNLREGPMKMLLAPAPPIDDINLNIDSKNDVNPNINGDAKIDSPQRQIVANLPLNPITNVKSGPTLWIHAKQLESGYLKHVFNVFESLGFATNGGENNWDVLWSHEYPFEELDHVIRRMKPGQKVNHFPGSGYITNKVSLATSEFKFVPKAFKLPEGKTKFQNYIKRFPNKLWVQKSNNHRGIRILAPNELDLSKEGTFVQEYISDPLLIDGHKFDIGVYAVLTSINPIRAYVVETEALFRFCPVKYYPFDASNVDKYVVGDIYTALWKIPTFYKLYKQRGFTFKESFNYYLKSQGQSPKEFWDKLKMAIASVYIEKEKFLIQANSHFKSSRNFFELVRFDFVLDKDFNIYLMEANMSPNLSSRTHEENARLYEHVIFNILSVVGIASRAALNFPNIVLDDDNMEVSDADINVFSDRCMAPECKSSNCTLWKCRLCNYCMTPREKLIAKMAYLEHINRGNTRRILPPVADTAEELAILTQTQISQESEENKFMSLWFLGQCQRDATWCH